MTKNNKNKKLEALDDSMIAEVAGGAQNILGSDIAVDVRGLFMTGRTGNGSGYNGHVDGDIVGDGPKTEVND